jgi:cysteine desulfuration protein SufE
MVSIEDVQDQIVREVSAKADWLDKYRYLVELGRKHPAMEDHLKTEAAAIPGCQSRVWIVTSEQDGTLAFSAASDSLIIAGILSLLLRVYDHRPAQDLARADPYFLRQTGLVAGLSPTRASGLAAIVRRLRECGERGLARSERS